MSVQKGGAGGYDDGQAGGMGKSRDKKRRAGLSAKTGGRSGQSEQKRAELGLQRMANHGPRVAEPLAERRRWFNLCGGGWEAVTAGGRACVGAGSRPGRVPAVMRRHLGYTLRLIGPQLRGRMAVIAGGGGGLAGICPH